MGENNYGEKFEDLRRKAEEALAEKKGSTNNLALEIDELIHELEVHQIELEMQNENLLKIQAELEESRRDYFELYDFAPVGYLTLNEKGIITGLNLAGAEILGKPRKNLINDAFIRFVPPSYKKTFHDHLQEVKTSHLKKQCQIELLSSSKNFLFVFLNTIAVLDQKEDFKEFRIILTDISKGKKAEREIEEANNQLKATIDAIPDLMFEVDEEGRFYDYNAPYPGSLYISSEQFMGKTVPEVLPPEAALKSMEALREAAEKGNHRGMTYELTFSDETKYFELSIAKKPIFKSKPHFIVLARDITERKNADQKIKKSLEEKEMLLKEIHHRVKNNLQVISSLLNLQARYIKNKTDKELFRESQTRAKSMALIHERLYQSKDLRRIDFGEYIETLTYDLYHSYSGNPDFIKLNMDLESIMVDINTAIPCGLIINELLSNALKHAFPNGRTGELNIKFYSLDGHLILSVRDNGIGFPENIDFKNTESLGLSLVNTLVGQIEGEIDIRVDHGTEFRITFPEVKFDD
jgi:PAS domain S-box-containing protein